MQISNYIAMKKNTQEFLNSGGSGSEKSNCFIFVYKGILYQIAVSQR